MMLNIILLYWILPTLITLLINLQVKRRVDRTPPEENNWLDTILFSAIWPVALPLLAVIIMIEGFPELWQALIKER